MRGGGIGEVETPGEGREGEGRGRGKGGGGGGEGGGGRGGERKGRGGGEGRRGGGRGGGEGEREGGGRGGEEGEEGGRDERRGGRDGWRGGWNEEEWRVRGREEDRITTAHRFWFGWRCLVYCRILGCLQRKERDRGGVRQARIENANLLCPPFLSSLLCSFLLPLTIICTWSITCTSACSGP